MKPECRRRPAGRTATRTRPAEAASHRGCSAWSAVTCGGCFCRRRRGGEATGCWVWTATSQEGRRFIGITYDNLVHEVALVIFN